MQASPMRRRRLRAWGLLAGALLLALAALASLALGSRPVPLAVTLMPCKPSIRTMIATWWYANCACRAPWWRCWPVQHWEWPAR